MFEKIGRLAEKAATNVNVSRRGFLGRLGNGALAVAGMLGFAASASGGATKLTCCCSYFVDQNGTHYGCGCYAGRTCPPGLFKPKHNACAYFVGVRC